MSTPTTKRDQRRLTRREQFQQRQEERRRARERQRRIEQYRQIGIIGGVVLAAVLVIWWGAASIIGGGAKATTAVLAAATGQNVDNISCGAEMTTVHYHADLQIYVDGQLQQVPAGVGIVLPDGTDSPHLASNGATACLYSLHTHDASGIIHIESPDSRSYTLGNLFDIWGQHLSTTQFMNHAVDAKHKLAIVVYDATGARHVVTGDPSKVVLSAHDTVVIQFNSAAELGSPYTQWNGL
jgi:hypothetical protein